MHKTPKFDDLKGKMVPMTLLVPAEVAAFVVSEMHLDKFFTVAEGSNEPQRILDMRSDFASRFIEYAENFGITYDTWESEYGNLHNKETAEAAGHGEGWRRYEEIRAKLGKPMDYGDAE